MCVSYDVNLQISLHDDSYKGGEGTIKVTKGMKVTIVVVLFAWKMKGNL